MKKRFLIFFPILIALCLTSVSTVYATQSFFVNRLAGNDRYETAFQIAKNGWQQSDNAVLTYGENYPDALAAVPLAKKLNAPILLTNTDSLDPTTRIALQDLRVDNVYIVGGTAVIPIEIEKQLINAGYIVKRIAGQDRYETAIRVAEELGDIKEVVVTTGDDYADALSIGPIAAYKQIPIILVPKENITSGIQNYISSRNIEKTYVIGDESIISDNVVNKFNRPERILGQDKYARNIAILNRFSDMYLHNKLCLASGENFADALTGSVYASKKNGAIALVRSDLPDLYKTNLREITYDVTIFGGEAVVPTSLIQDIFNNLNIVSVENLDLGVIESKTYINKYFGLKMTIPDKWEVNDVTSDNELLNISKKIGITDYSNLYIRVARPPLDISNIEDFRNYLNNYYENSSVFELPKEMYSEKIDGVYFKVVEINMKIKPTITMHIKIYFTEIKGYNFSIMTGNLNNTDFTELNNIINSIKLN